MSFRDGSGAPSDPVPFVPSCNLRQRAVFNISSKIACSSRARTFPFPPPSAMWFLQLLFRRCEIFWLLRAVVCIFQWPEA